LQARRISKDSVAATEESEPPRRRRMTGPLRETGAAASLDFPDFPGRCAISVSSKAMIS
jgi:hypothetical protein